LESQGTRKIKELAFCREEDKKTTFEAPFFFFTSILRRSNSNTQVIIENQAMINM
jgi:hypothetical protein